MNVVTVSSKYQIVIPKELRQRLGIEPGQKVQAFALEDRIELVPIRPLKTLRGFLKGIDTTVDRDADRV
jgi:AbrB family looped-hinge helix DNA binding protein